MLQKSLVAALQQVLVQVKGAMPEHSTTKTQEDHSHTSHDTDTPRHCDFGDDDDGVGDGNGDDADFWHDGGQPISAMPAKTAAPTNTHIGSQDGNAGNTPSRPRRPSVPVVGKSLFWTNLVFSLNSPNLIEL